jgi:hypothetical protein
VPPLIYHAGQIAVQEEANTRALADHLAQWVGPVAEFAEQADLFLLTRPGEGGVLRFTILAGPPPMTRVLGPATLGLDIPEGTDLPEGRYGGLAINLSLARRARLNGLLSYGNDGAAFTADETFTLCRKYMAPSIGQGTTVITGPAARAEAPLDSPALQALLARAETSFIASVSPEGGPDVAHRGGPPGFISFDPATGLLTWPELLGDGVFKSAGNVRATGVFTLLVPDIETGEAFELVAERATYVNERTSRKQRLDALVQERDHFPTQGVISATVTSVSHLTGALHPRTRIEKALKYTSCSPVHEQAPQ